MFKKNLIILILIVPFCLNALEIYKNKNFVSFVDTTLQTASFSLKHTANKDTKIEEVFSKAIKSANKTGICTGGQYAIYPNYRYINNERVKKGYSSNLTFNCEFKDIELYQNLLSTMKDLNVELIQNKIKYKITMKSQEEETLKLEQEAYDYAKDYSEYLETQFESCAIKTIDFTNRYTTFPPIIKNSLSSNETKASSPIKNDVEIKLSTKFVFECGINNNI